MTDRVGVRGKMGGGTAQEGNARSSAPYLRVGVYSLLVNVALAAIKIVLSFTTGSLALRADGIHSSVDVFASIGLIVGLAISGRKTRSFPYGMYKVENIVTVAIAILLFVSAFEVVDAAFTGQTGVVSYSGWVIGVVGALVLAPFLFSRYEIAVGKRYNSPSLVADGRQFTADVISASIVFFALVGQSFGIPLDRIAAGIVAIFIARAGWGLLSSSMRVLLDASIDTDTLNRMRAAIQTEPAVGSIKSITGRNSGRYIFVEAVVTMKVSDLNKAHEISQRMEDKIKEQHCCVDRVLIHYEPEVRQSVRYAVPLAGSDEKIGEHFGESPRFVLIDVDTRTRRVTNQEIVANPHVNLEKGRGVEVARFLLSHHPDTVVSREDLSGKGPGYAFSDAGVRTVQTQATVLPDLIKELLANLQSAGS